MFHCFGCGVSGDAIKFVMQVEGRSFREAVEQLANEAGVDLTPPDPEEARRSARRAALAEVNEKACTFYERCSGSIQGRDRARAPAQARHHRGHGQGVASRILPQSLGFIDQVPRPEGRRSAPGRGGRPGGSAQEGAGPVRPVSWPADDPDPRERPIVGFGGRLLEGRARRSTSTRPTRRSTRRVSRSSRWTGPAMPSGAKRWRCSSRDTSTPSGFTRRVW